MTDLDSFQSTDAAEIFRAGIKERAGESVVWLECDCSATLARPVPASRARDDRRAPRVCLYAAMKVPKWLQGARQRRRAVALAGSGILVGFAAPVVGVAMVFIGITVYAVNVLSRNR